MVVSYPCAISSHFSPHVNISLQAVVKSLPEDPNLTITLTVGGRQRNLDRPKSEPLEKPLGRIQKSAAPPPEKKSKKNSASAATATAAAAPSPAPFVGLHAGPTPDHPLLDPSATSNEDAWLQGRLLRIGDTEYLIEVNPPLAEGLETHGTPFIGIPVVAVPKLIFADLGECTWQWWRRLPGTKESIKGPKSPIADWEIILDAQGQGYIPRDEDAGYMLRVECTPIRKNSDGSGVAVGGAVSAEVGPVAVPPHPSSACGRKELTPVPLSPPFFRVVTYNILADQYASTDAAKTQLFATCPPECLEPSYRRPLVLSEILQYNADVICLQEVDDRMYTMCLEPAMRLAGFEGAFTNKAGKVREGAAAFWRRDRFRLKTRRDVALKNLFPPTSQPSDIAAAKYGPPFAPMLRSSPALCTALQRVATIGQLLLLEPTDPITDPALRPICLVNTHLFFHYAAPHIRTMHVWALLQEAAELIKESSSTDRPAVLFCGDLNSDLNDGIPGAIELLSKGNLPSDYWDWAFGVNFKWKKQEEAEGAEQSTTTPATNKESKKPKTTKPEEGNTTSNVAGTAEGGEISKMLHTEVERRHPSSPRSPEELVPGVSLTSPFALAAADRLRSNVTNYVRGYEGLLDYVWYESDALVVDKVIPVPAKEQLGGYIPNRRYPSDHLAVVVDLKFIRTDGTDGTAGVSGKESGTAGGTANSGSGFDGSDGGGVGDGGHQSVPIGFADEITGRGCLLPAALYNVGVAAEVLNRGGVLAVPTDTIYGLAACASKDEAVTHIYDAKARSGHKPLAICVADHDDVARYVYTDHLPRKLLEDLLPGPLTVLLQRKEDAPLAQTLNPGISTLAVRIPDCKFIRAVCRQHRSAIALTSANVSGHPSCISTEEFEPLWPDCDVVFDGGIIPGNRDGSTIVDLTVPGQFKIVREGAGLEAALNTLIGTYGYTRMN